MQEGGTNPKPAQRFQKGSISALGGQAQAKRSAKSTPSMKRAGLVLDCKGNLAALGINCHVVCPQKLDERNKRVKTDGLDAKALCLKLDRFVQGNREALALVRVPD